MGGIIPPYFFGKDIGDMYDYLKLPEGLQYSMKCYIEKGIRTGGFLTACLENDLLAAVNRADKTNLARLKDVVQWIYNEAPSDCWGSREKVQAWKKEV